jgi:hypothetical protein
MGEIQVPVDFAAECALALSEAGQREVIRRAVVDWATLAVEAAVRSKCCDVFDQPGGEILPFVLSEDKRAVAGALLAGFLSAGKGSRALVFGELSLADAGFWAVGLRDREYHDLGPANVRDSPLLLFRPAGRQITPRERVFEGWAELQREKNGFVLTISVLKDWLERNAPNSDPGEFQLLVPAGEQSGRSAWTTSDIFASPKVQAGPAKQVLLTFGSYRPETIIRLSALGATGAWIGLRSGRSSVLLAAVQLSDLAERVRLPAILGRPWREYQFVNWPQRLHLPRVGEAGRAVRRLAARTDQAEFAFADCATSPPSLIPRTSAGASSWFGSLSNKSPAIPAPRAALETRSLHER